MNYIPGDPFPNEQEDREGIREVIHCVCRFIMFVPERFFAC